MTASTPLHDALPAPGEPFALLHRAHTPQHVEVLSGALRAVACLDDLDLDAAVDGGGTVLVLTPFRQVAERGFHTVDDGEPLLAMTVASRAAVPLDDTMAELPDRVPEVTGLAFDLDDGEYADGVRRIVDDEIAAGEGANFVFARTLSGTFTTFGRGAALAAFRRLLVAESGAYWTFLVCTGDRYLIGGSPEQHVHVAGDELRMNPISGTYRYPEGGGDTVDRGLLRFLADEKECDELYMVVDEELKMMAALCEADVEVSGPALRRMSRLAHTEYYLSGPCRRSLSEVLRRTMFAPTVTGSPLENACRAIARNEPRGRGYYSGVLALAEQREGRRRLDSTILIRTADVRADGRLRITSGATIVRHSQPRDEADETSAKVAGLLRVLAAGVGPDSPVPGPTVTPEVDETLRRRNDTVSAFWRRASAPCREPLDADVRIVGAEDDFTAMLDHQLRSVGCRTTTDTGADATVVPGRREVVLLGPGPGDPRDIDEPRIARLRSVADRALRAGRPVVAVCLGHQVVCGLAGLPLQRLPEPNQGRRIRVRTGGREVWAGFYNSFAAGGAEDSVVVPGGGIARVERDPSGWVLGLRGGGLATLQFHAESFLTQDGPELLRDLVAAALATAPATATTVAAPTDTGGRDRADVPARRSA